MVATKAIVTDFGGGAVRDNSDFNQALTSQTALGRVGLLNDILDLWLPVYLQMIRNG